MVQQALLQQHLPRGVWACSGVGVDVVTLLILEEGVEKLLLLGQFAARTRGVPREAAVSAGVPGDPRCRALFRPQVEVLPGGSLLLVEIRWGCEPGWVLGLLSAACCPSLRLGVVKRQAKGVELLAEWAVPFLENTTCAGGGAPEGRP